MRVVYKSDDGRKEFDTPAECEFYDLLQTAGLYLDSYTQDNLWKLLETNYVMTPKWMETPNETD